MGGRVFVVFWSGWGLLVPVAGFVGLMASLLVAAPLLRGAGVGGMLAEALAFALGAAIAAALLHGFCEIHERRHAEMIFDEQTGRQFKLRNSSGSLFFLSMRTWAWAYVVGIPLSLVQVFR